MKSSSGRTASAVPTSMLELAQANDLDAWRQLVDIYGPLIYHWCRRAGLSADDSADLVQELFRKVVVAIGRFRNDQPGATFRGWLWTITRNKIRDFARTQTNKAIAAGGTRATELFRELPNGEPVDQTLAANAARDSALLRRAFKLVRIEFQQNTWDAFCQTVLQERTSTDTAKDLGMTANAVRHAKARVLRRLREVLGEL